MVKKIYCDVCDREAETTKNVIVGETKKDVCSECLDEMFNKKKKKSNYNGGVNDLMNNFRNNVGNLFKN